MCGPGCNGNEGPLSRQTRADQPCCRFLLGGGAHKKIRRSTVRRYIQVPSSREVALRDRPRITVTISFGADEEGTGHPMLWIRAPATGGKDPKSAAAQAAMQIETMAE